MEFLDEFLFNIHDTNSIVTGGRVKPGKSYCPVDCTFCICKGDETGIKYKIPFITKDQLLQGLKFVNWDNLVIMLGDGISSLSAEAFAHPSIYEFLDIICNLFPEHTVKIITTGIFIKKSKIDFLNSLENLHLSISANTFQEPERSQLMPYPQTEKLKLLVKELKRIAVTLFDVGSLDVLKRDLETIVELRPFFNTGIQVRRLEHTKYHKQNAKDLSLKSINNFENSLEYIRNCNQSGSINYWSPYVRYSMYNKRERESIENYVMDVVKYCRQRRDERIVLCMAESAYTEWSHWLRDEMNVIPILVKNETYGGSITNAGLMTFDDVKIALKIALKRSNVSKPSRILVPSIMLNKAFQDLKKKYLIEFESEIGVSVTVV